jgi:phosphate-selective porin OprO/OprP
MSFPPARAEEPPAEPAPAVEEPQAEPAATVDEVDERLKILERNREIEAEQAAERAKNAPIVTAGKDGFSLRSADGSWVLRLRGYIQFDGRFIDNEGSSPGTDTFVLRRVRPIFEGTVGGRFDFKIMPDFGEGKTVLQDAYADARLSASTKLRLGKFKSPFGLERLQSAQDLEFVERALPTNLVPNRDLGVMGFGELSKGAFEWQLGIFNGVPDGSSGDVDSNDGKDGVGRIFVRPFRSGAMKGLGLGLAGSAGVQQGTATSTGLASYYTGGLQIFYSWRTGAAPGTTVVADGRRTRWSPQAWFGIGPVGVMAEYVVTSEAVALGAASDTIGVAAWQATVTWVLTGEDASYRGVTPRRPLGQGGGAWEVVARAGALSVDGEAFPVYADPDASARRAQEVRIGLNGWLSRNVRGMADLSRTTFRGGAPAGGDRDDELAALTRFQVAF